MMLKLVDTSQKFIVLGIFILDKVTRLRALLDPPPPQDGVSEFTGRYPLKPTTAFVKLWFNQWLMLGHMALYKLYITISLIGEKCQCF